MFRNPDFKSTGFKGRTVILVYDFSTPRTAFRAVFHLLHRGIVCIKRHRKILNWFRLMMFPLIFKWKRETGGIKRILHVISKYPRLTKKRTDIGWRVCGLITRKAWLFFIQFNGVFVGVTYFHSISYTDKSADFGIYIANVENRNKGVGTIVLKKMIRYAADVMRFRRLFLDVLASNERAIAVYESCGFAPTGENDGDFYRYVLELS